MKNDNYIYEDDPQELAKQYARLYLFGGYCLIFAALFAVSMLAGLIYLIIKFIWLHF